MYSRIAPAHQLVHSVGVLGAEGLLHSPVNSGIRGAVSVVQLALPACSWAATAFPAETSSPSDATAGVGARATAASAAARSETRRADTGPTLAAHGVRAIPEFPLGGRVEQRRVAPSPVLRCALPAAMLH
jgi:hypothetical protein